MGHWLRCDPLSLVWVVLVLSVYRPRSAACAASHLAVEVAPAVVGGVAPMTPAAFHLCKSMI